MSREVKVMPKRNNGFLKFFILIIIIAIIVAVIAVIKVKRNNKKYNFELTTISENEAKYFVLKKGEKFGVIDNTGKIIINPEFDDVEIPNPTKGIFLVCDNLNSDDATYKAFDGNGNQILSQFEDVEAIQINQLTSTVPYEKSVLKYKNGNDYGLIDFEGNIVKEAQYEEIDNLDYKEGFLKVMKQGKCGIINIKGEEIIPTEYDDISSDGYYSDETKYAFSGFITRIKTDDGYRFRIY